MSKLSFFNKTVVVTGAASGLGREIAKLLAKREKANLIIADRHRERLSRLKKEIERATGTKVHAIVIDLSAKDAARTLFNKATKIADIYAIINNAGLGFFGYTLDRHLDFYEEMINVNQLTVIKTVLLFCEYFLKKGGGAILNITSMGGLLTIPYQNVYSATKHAVQSFTKALSVEYRKKGITFCTFAPGGIFTEMITSAGLDKHFGTSRIVFMPPEKAARLAVAGFKKRKLVTIPGFINKLTVFLQRIFSKKFETKIAGWIYTPKNS